MDPGSRRRTIAVDCLRRIEGDAGVHVTLKGGHVEDVQVRVFEPPRLFEALLRGRHYSEVPDFVARLCGICPVAHQLTSVQAIESILGIEPDASIRMLRRLMYCGEWIESHTLHVYFLHAPDFLACPDVIALSAKHKPLVERGLRLKRAGNRIVETLGGREIHPVSLAVGGFHRVPGRSELVALRDELCRARDAAVETVRFVSGFEFPDFDQDYEFVALTNSEEYAMLSGRVLSSTGKSVELIEQQVSYSHALQSRIRGSGSYLVGPLARFALNFGQLPETAAAVARECGLVSPCRNPFRSIVVRSVEIICACEEALAIIERYEPPPAALISCAARAGCGRAVTEAPRGTLFHQYTISGNGIVLEAKIIPPTAQNQKRMEEDVCHMAERSAALAGAAMRDQCSRVVRNYDPCMSCATHCVVLERDE